jgi:hypothetical protein
MAPKTEGKKKPKETYEVFKEIDQRNRSGLGWSPKDFGIYQYTNVAPSAQFNVIPKTASGAAISGSAPQAINDPAIAKGRFPNTVLPGNTPASAVLTPQQQQDVRKFIQDPQEVAAGSGPIDAVKSFLANVFDTSDTFDPTKSNAIMGYVGGDGPVETVWDSLLAGLGWGYDRLTQLTVAGMSGLPGGTETLTWDEAADVSFGQQFVANMGVSAGKLRRGEGNIGDVLSLGPFGAMAGIFDPTSPIQQAGWDIRNEQDRKVFEEGPEKFWSGVADFGFVFADPLILGGKGAKMARIKWIDRPLDTAQGRAALKSELELGATAGNGTQPLSPAADFVTWATEKLPDGAKARSPEEIFNHPMIKFSAMREQVASALYNADDYETGALLFRFAKGDAEAGVQLFQKRADLVDAMAAADRQRIMTIAAMNPDQIHRAQRVANNAFRKADTEVKRLEELGMQSTPQWDLANRFRLNALDTYNDISNGVFDPVNLATPQGVAASKEIFKSIVRSDQALAKAIDETGDIGGGIFNTITGVKGVPSNTPIGRLVEKSRQRRATAQYQAAASRGALVQTGKAIVRKDGSTTYVMKRQNLSPLRRTYWQKDEFNVGGFRRGVRLWRWAGEENPSGYIVTKGLGAQESFREIRASMNDVEIYSGQARTITLDSGEVIQVGGIQRKEQLLQMYMDAVNDTTGGANRAQLALDQIEEAMMNDILSWHGIPKENADLIKGKARQVRADTLESLRDPERNFFVNDDGNFDKIPWLEQHLQNGTYMLNYRALEKAARLADEQGLIKALDGTQQYISQNFMRIYGVFNDFWRPSVLLRLGYTMRNVAEGQFRAAAFTSSLDPARYGVEAGLYSLRNSAVSFAGKKAIRTAVNNARMRAAGQATVPMPRKYQKWLEAQIVAREADIQRFDGVIRANGVSLADMSLDYRNYMISYFEKVQNDALDALVRARALGAGADELAARQADIDDAYRGIQELQKKRRFSGISNDSQIAFEQLKAHVAFRDDSIARRAILDDEEAAVRLYAQQGNAKRRVFSKPLVGADGRVWQQAFASESPFTPVAMSLSSADTTQQSMLQLSMDMTSNVFKAMRQRSYQKVLPGQPNYFEGLATNLANIKNSAIGSRLIRGESNDQIADFLMSPGEGNEIMDFLMQGKKFTRDDALDAAETVRSRYEQLAPSPELREFIRVTNIDENFNGKLLEDLFGQKNAQGEFVNQFAPIVGNIAEDFGFKNPVETWRATTSWLMKWLGTIPEDTLVRQPFYGVRFNQFLTQAVREAESQVDRELTMKEITGMYRLAHSRALKDTKDWLYTIDRRTNLGTYGEVAIPFISAAQNSVTTVGRLIYNDPTTAVIMADMWKAPNAAGFEDEEGNIVIPIPHEIIPDAVEEALGLSTMENWKIRKSSLNVIVPESGFGFIPRPGPLVAAPASEIMKHGWFGVSVESPEFLRQFFGKEGADQVWNVAKNYAFGEGQGIAPDMLSLSMLTPPVAQKVIQMIQGTDNAQFGYYYNLIYRSEMLNWMGGYRDEQPTKEEIADKTRGLTMARLLANIASFTPPQYESKIDPLIDAVRKIEAQDPANAPKIIYQTYGPLLQMIGDFSNSKNYSGMGPYADSVGIARKYSYLINEMSPSLEKLGDLSVLSMMTMGATSSALYDDSAYGWQFSNAIPGVNVNFREMQKPEQAWTQSRINTGWTMYISKMDELDARLKQAGYDSYRQAPELKAERDAFLAQMAENPLFFEWWQDYKEFGSSRTLSSIALMERLTTDEKFMAEYGNTNIWANAKSYLYHRNLVMQEMASREGSIDNNDNEIVRDYWDQVRAQLKQDPDWAAFANRFLNGDDDPESPGVQIATYYQSPEVGG